jgi:hypothetical protein
MRIIGSVLHNKNNTSGRLDEAVWNASSRPISLLSVDSNDTIVNNHESTLEDDEQDGEEEDTEVPNSPVRHETWRHKLDNLKFYSNQKSGDEINTNLNEQIESLHRTLEIFLEASSRQNSNQSRDRSNEQRLLYTDSYRSSQSTKASDFYARDHASNSPVTPAAAAKDNNSEVIRNRLFFNFNNRNNSVYLNGVNEESKGRCSGTAAIEDQQIQSEAVRGKFKTIESGSSKGAESATASNSILNKFFNLLFYKRHKLI